MAQWLGYMVSIKCSDQICYQGEINSATTSHITLVKAFRNGIPCPQNEVTISASNILELKLIDKQANTLSQSTVTIAKPVPKKAFKTLEPSASFKPQNRSKPIDIDTKLGENSVTPNKIRNKNKTKSWKDEECFGSPLDHKIDKEFDFEKNLALFDKRAIWDELNSQKPDVIRNLDGNKKPTKYRHDENIIATTPATYRQIFVPKQEFCEYVTDDGLIIPSVSRALRKKLFEIADRTGLNWDRRIELFGRAASEISVQLLGGGHRLNPHNAHQCPTVVILCGPHKQGAMGINAARQLSSHGVRTNILIPATDPGAIKKELTLYNLTKNPVHTHSSTLPNLVDLIIVALCEDTDAPKCPQDITDWVQRHHKTPVLALDPPSSGVPGITPKFSLLPVLPLPHSKRNGKLYLCNLGFPCEIFAEAGIKYKSPFGPKFVIPLHPKDE